MDKIKKIITFLSVLCVLNANVYADDSPENYINVIQSVNGEQTTVYSGSPEGYGNGIFTDVDYFLELDYAVIFNQDSPDNEMLYIVPSTSDVHLGDITANAQPMQNTMQLQNTVTSSAISTNVSLMYNDEYHESVLLPGETLTVPVTVTNSGELTAEINSYIATYDLTGKLINITQGNLITVPGNQTVTANVSNEFDVDTACTAKVFFWQKDNINPVADSIYLTVQSQDYYADAYDMANKVDISNRICGVINTSADVDIIKFTPTITGVYALQLDASNGTVCGLYDNSQSLLNSVSAVEDKNYLLYSLTANQNYYIRFDGLEDNAYEITPALPNDFKTVTQNVGIESDIDNYTDYNVYKFIPSKTNDYIVTAVNSSSVKADLYNSSFEKIAPSDLSDELVSFRITNNMTENQIYYIVVYPKDGNDSGNYTLYVEEPLALISIE